MLNKYVTVFKKKKSESESGRACARERDQVYQFSFRHETVMKNNGKAKREVTIFTKTKGVKYTYNLYKLFSKRNSI